MSNFKIPDLCGASPELNLASSKIADLESQITSQINAEASAAKAAIESKLTDVKLGLDGLVPDLPELPNLNFQSELTSLISFDISTPQGLTQYTSKLNDLKLKFGDTLTKSGKDFDSLVSSATDAISGGGNVCGVVPNLELPAAGGEVLEKAEGVKAALENAIDEEVSTVSDNVNATALKAELESTTASYADKTTYEITEKSTKITTPAGTKVSATTKSDAGASGYSEKGFAYKKGKKTLVYISPEFRAIMDLKTPDGKPVGGVANKARKYKDFDIPIDAVQWLNEEAFDYSELSDFIEKEIYFPMPTKILSAGAVEVRLNDAGTKVITKGLIYRLSLANAYLKRIKSGVKGKDNVTKNLAALNVSIVQEEFSSILAFAFDGEQYDLAEGTWDYIKIIYEYNEKIDAGIKKDE